MRIGNIEMAKTSNKIKPKVVRVPKKYAGEYIAWRSWHSKQIVAHSKDPSVAYNDARCSGAKHPVLMFIREPDLVCVY